MKGDGYSRFAKCSFRPVAGTLGVRRRRGAAGLASPGERNGGSAARRGPHGAFWGRLLFTFLGRIGKEMRRVELTLRRWMIADAMAELRIWLDHYNCVPLSFEISRSPNRGVH